MEGVLMQTSYDVVVVGGGGSGLAAALSAAQRGASACVLEKQPQLGGSTSIAVGSFTANRTHYQQRLGISDSPEDHDEDTGKFSPPGLEARNNRTLRRFLLTHAADTFRWLTDMGVVFHGPSPEPPNRVPRMHNVVPNAKAYIAALHSQLLRHGATIVVNCPARSLVRENGRVVGVRAGYNGQSVTFTARRGVVLGAGDYSNSPEMIGRYKGEQYTRVEGINPFCTGDGHRLAESVGGRLVNMDVTLGPEFRFVAPLDKGFMQLLPAGGPLAWLMGRMLPLVPQWVIRRMIKRLLVTWQHPDNKLLDDGIILVNSRGERYCNERLAPDREIATASQAGKIAFMLLDERLTERYSRWPNFVSTAPEIAYAYVQDYLRLRPDVSSAGNSLAEVAAARSLPIRSFEKTVETFNCYVAGKIPDPFGRTGDHEPLRGNRWVLLGPLKPYFTLTDGGVLVNESLQVLDEAGLPIEGLYAVGQNGLGGQILWAHGLHIAWAMTSGRLVGEILGTQGRSSAVNA